MNLKWIAKCKDCLWESKFESRNIADQSAEVHDEILRPGHHAYVEALA